MTPRTFTCPGKIFIIGEYSCLKGHPAIVASLTPEYKILLENQNIRNKELPKNPFQPDSPAGKLWEEIYNSKNKSETNINFIKWLDPFPVTMGFGSSTAQFLLTYLVGAYIKNISTPTEHELLVKYWKIAEKNKKTPTLLPSGLDLLNQFFGGTNILSAKKISEERVSIKQSSIPIWNSTETEVLLYFTNQKIPTHVHLSKLASDNFLSNQDHLMDALCELTLMTHKIWKEYDGVKLGTIFNSYQNLLNIAEIGDRDFQSLVHEISKLRGVLGCKGSGAQGGDCLILIVEKKYIDEIRNSIFSTRGQFIQPQWQVLNHS